MERATSLASKLVTKLRKGFRVLPITLETGETLPTLVHASDWLPVRVATRWAVRRRRFECMDSTLAHDLRAIGLLYEWAAVTLRGDLDDLLERSEVPTCRELESLAAFLRLKGSRASSSTSLNTLPTVAGQVAAIRPFLAWATDPANQGSSRTKPVQQIAEERRLLVEVFRPIVRYSGASQRIPVLSDAHVDRINALIGPDRDEGGRLVVPLTFNEQNPFRPPSRLRNWLMLVIAYQCGLRRGELLKLRLDDVPRSTDPGLKIRRRPHDGADARRHKPRVKTVERVLPISDEIRAGLRGYLASPLPFGRPSGGTPYLFTSAKGAPLSITAADEIVKIIAWHIGLALSIQHYRFCNSWTATAVMRHLAWATARILLGLGKRTQNSKFLRFSGDYATSSRYQT